MNRNIAAWIAFVSLAAASPAADAGGVGDLGPFFGQKQFHIMAPYDALFSPQGDLVATVVCDPTRSDAAAAKGDAGARADVGAATVNSPYLSMGCDVWLYDVAGGPPRTLGDGRGSSWSPAWSPDGSRLVFHSDRDGDNRLWLWERGSGQVRRLSATPTLQGNASDLPLWTPDGRSVVAQLPRAAPAPAAERDDGNQPGAGTAASGGTAAAAGAGEKAGGSTVVVYAAGAMAAPQQARETTHSGSWKRVDIGLFDVATGQARMLARDARASTRKLSPDGRHLAYLVDVPARDTATRGFDFALVTLDLHSGRSTSLVERMFQEMPGAFSWSPDGRWLAYVDTLRERRTRGAGEQASLQDVSEGGDLHVVPATGGAARRIAGAPAFNFHSYIEAPAWDASGRHIYLVGKDGALWRTRGPTGPLERLAAGAGDDRFRQLVRRDGKDRIATGEDGRVAYLTYRNERDLSAGLAKVDLASGEVAPLFRDAIKLPASLRMSQQSGDGRRIAFVSASIDRPEDIWLAEGDFRTPRKLSDLNPELSAMTLGKSRIIDFNSRDGKPLRASVLLPANYEPGKRYPTLFWVYASDSDTASSANDFGLVGFGQFNLQILAANGYAVVWPEIPTRVGTPVRDLVSAVTGAAERVAALGIADPRRLAVMGNSNGGYSTLALLTQTDMFKLGVMNAGFGDLTAFYSTFNGSWIGWLEQQGGGMGVAPWEAPHRYLENSPIYYLDRITTPLIIQAGTADTAIIDHSDAVWVGMKRLGKDVIYLRYEGEGHVLSSGANIRDFWSRVLPALDKYVRGVPGAKDG